MIKNPDEIREQMRLAGEKWADLDGCASLLEESKRSVRAQIALGAGEVSVAKAEMTADASKGYREHLESMVKARTAANRARVNYDCMKAWAELARTLESSRRAEMQLR